MLENVLLAKSLGNGFPIGAKRCLLEFVVLVVAVTVSAVGKHLWHNAIDLIEVSFGPQRMARRLHEAIQTEAINFVKVPFDGCHICVARHGSSVLLVVRLFSRIVQIVCVMLEYVQQRNSR